MTADAKKIRETILTMAYYGNDGNLQSSFSSVEIIKVLYDRCLFCKEDSTETNHFILSKGQSSMALLATLFNMNLLPQKEIVTTCQYDSRISMQIDRTKFNNIETSAGSLGHGFPMAVGYALGLKIQNNLGRVFCLAGDGEMNEGTMWEAAMFAGPEKLNNLTLIVDDNDSIKKMIQIDDFMSKMSAFGFYTIITNGHNEEQIAEALDYHHNEMPLCIIAKTQRGFGSKTLMNDDSWFHRAPSREELKILIDEVRQFEC